MHGSLDGCPEYENNPQFISGHKYCDYTISTTTASSTTASMFMKSRHVKKMHTLFVIKSYSKRKSQVKIHTLHF